MQRLNNERSRTLLKNSNRCRKPDQSKQDRTSTVLWNVSHKIDTMEVVIRCAFLRHVARRKSSTENREREQAVVWITTKNPDFSDLFRGEFETMDQQDWGWDLRISFFHTVW